MEEENKSNKTLTRNPNPKQEQPNNPFSLFFPTLNSFKIQLPSFFPFNQFHQPTNQQVKPTTARTETPTPSFATFPNKKAAPGSVSISSEAEPVLEEESVGRSDNSIVAWQVYALGGFIVLKWIWARWTERTERQAKKPSSDDARLPEEHQSPVDGDE